MVYLPYMANITVVLIDNSVYIYLKMRNTYIHTFGFKKNFDSIHILTAVSILFTIDQSELFL